MLFRSTLTTYISALDDRVKAAAPACYITSWQELLPGPGPQDAEQSFPGFLSEGLNIADYLELFAPKPWLNANTIDDFFPLEGARQTVEEARRIYALYGAEEKLGWFVGPGGHGVPLQSREAIYAWFIKWLQDGKGDPREEPVDLDPSDAILCTRTGQVSDSLGGETVYSLNRKRAADLIARKQPVNAAADVESLRSRLRKDIRDVAAVRLEPGGAPPKVTVHSAAAREGYAVEVVSFPSAAGMRIPGVLLVPDAPGRKRAVLVVDPRPKQALAAPNGDLAGLAEAGFVVLAIQPSGVAESAVAGGGASLIGDHGMAIRAAIVGKTLPGMRVEDTIRAVDYLVSRADSDGPSVTAIGQGALGPVVLHAAVLDDRIQRVVLQDSLALYKMAVDRPIHRNIHEQAPAGVLRKYDLDDLLAAVSPRAVVVVNPVDALGEPLRLSEFREAARYAFEADGKLGRAKRLQVLHRGRGTRLAALVGAK